jgi:hypothetical protein
VPAITFRHVLGTDPTSPNTRSSRQRQGPTFSLSAVPTSTIWRRRWPRRIAALRTGESEVEIRVVDRIPRNQASGKLKRFIAL